MYKYAIIALLLIGSAQAQNRMDYSFRKAGNYTDTVKCKFWLQVNDSTVQQINGYKIVKTNISEGDHTSVSYSVNGVVTSEKYYTTSYVRVYTVIKVESGFDYFNYGNRFDYSLNQ